MDSSTRSSVKVVVGVVGCSGVCTRVARLSGACLRGHAAVWWKIYLDIHLKPTTWAEFRELFYYEFIPKQVRLRLREGFLALRQGNRLLMQHMGRFRYLLLFSMDVAGTEMLQNYYFIIGVDERIADAIVSTGATTLQEVYDRALSYETLLLEREGRRMTGCKSENVSAPQPSCNLQSVAQGAEVDREFSNSVMAQAVTPLE
ncbi:hypothetical protein Syun_006052 [Stephania yunnanensis]|uniref:Retrotransposon gag domain-containing protein n=1 Tax=Stephania yunnanensis TaxID=152371 RepID=A0AAP0KVY2_9MAGN